MNEIRLELIGITYNQIESGVYALILQEVGTRRRIPIIIGYSEAQTIECKLQNIQPPRPLTHDMTASILRGLGATLSKVLIRKLPNGVFAADLTIDGPQGRCIIDARSSDAIALAIRTDTPIFTTREVLDEAGFEYTEDDKPVRTAQSSSSAPGGASRAATGADPRTRAELLDAINRASEAEDYEEAARLKKLLDSLPK
ncbi:MAG: bifunctional nuclease family protein [Muribaculaceae bacterium]|nr:bifunctional nuclease family protein [Muribaculaceae bacterium]